MKYSSKLWLTLVVFLAMTTNGQALTITASGLSATGDNVAFRADFTILEDSLTLTLFNNSPKASNSRDDVLSSFYFDILKGDGSRPLLTYASAFGNVYSTSRGNDDALVGLTSLFEASTSIDGGWAFRSGPAPDGLDITKKPYLYFGLGTVGNNTGVNTLFPNNFQGNVVGGINYSIYHGEVTEQSLADLFMVRDSATFTFSGLTGFTENDILRSVFFGLGTGPDSNLTTPPTNPVPEPATMLLFGAGLAGLAGIARKRKKQ